MSIRISFVRKGVLPVAVAGGIAVSLLAAMPGPARASRAAGATVSTADCDSATTCYTPQQIEVA